MRISLFPLVSRKSSWIFLLPLVLAARASVVPLTTDSLQLYPEYDALPSLRQAVDYANLRPTERERGRAVDLLLLAEKDVSNPTVQAKIHHRIARLYLQNFDPETEIRNAGEGIRHYRTAAALLEGMPSLLSSQIDVELAFAIKNSGNEAGAAALCRAVVARDSREILSGEISEERIQSLKKPRPRDHAMKAPPDVLDSFFKERLERFKAGIESEYLSIQKSVVRCLVSLEFKAGGRDALLKLAGELDISALRSVVEEAMTREAKHP